jgi:hypothetical protein
MYYLILLSTSLLLLGHCTCKINPLKTRILDCSKHPSVDECWEMNGIDIKPSDSVVHLGVTRSGIKEVEVNIEERIKCARRTKYGIFPL